MAEIKVDVTQVEAMFDDDRIVKGWRHPDFTERVTLEDLLNHLNEKIERLESAYISVDAEIKYERESP